MSLLSPFMPSAKQAREMYVDKRMRHLARNDDDKTKAVAAVIQKLQQRARVVEDWKRSYDRIQWGLHNAELTINLDAADWFTEDNTYTTYAQMYERALQADGHLKLKDNKLNKAAGRALVDDLVTIPDDWRDANPLSERYRLHKTFHATGGTNASLKNMETPKLRGDGDTGFDVRGKHFKARAKQVFAALNYGRRLHGSSTAYGFSHLVLKSSLKERAMYYPQDTFFTAGKGVSHQASYHTLGAVLQYAGTDLSEAIWDGCYARRYLPDTARGEELLEAHLFQDVKLNQDVEELLLSRQRKSEEQPFTQADWDKVQANAVRWCKRNSVRLVIVP